MKPFAVLLTVLLCVSGRADAHEARPGFLELREVAPNRFEMLWKQPALGELRLRINPAFPEECTLEGMGDQQMLPGALLWRTTLVCDGGIPGKSIAVVGLEATLTDVLVRVHHANGATETHLLKPASPSAVIGGQSQGPGAYVTLGIEHIVLGIDHLLFVLGLLLIVKDRWMLLKTITSFTLAHSATLAIATLGYASAPVLPLNAAIALSILFLGPEIVRSWRGETSFTIRHPWVVAFAFGLLHGFGFASGLTAMGLPRAEIPLALLLFNFGVEIGQLLFVVLVLLMERSFRTLEIRWPRWAELVPGYVVGTLGAFWAIQRSAMLFGGAP
ncbi:MAG TPA: HupE/UreJ family protein [Vicinamibacteria bacterium]|nr:HupE/UreJ family protein [Vicinamibacteria bacterium]